jgi:hypothetical protein
VPKIQLFVVGLPRVFRSSDLNRSIIDHMTSVEQSIRLHDVDDNRAPEISLEVAIVSLSVHSNFFFGPSQFVRSIFLKEDKLVFFPIG